MRLRSVVAVVVVMLFTLSIAAVGFTAEHPGTPVEKAKPKETKEAKGTVSKVEGAKITVKDDKGKETTVEDKTAKDIKVGDKVTVKDGKVTKDAGEKPAEKGKTKKKIEGC